jgi:hypothetical protein
MNKLWVSVVGATILFSDTKDIVAGKTRVSVKTKKLRGKASVRGGAGTAASTVGLLGGILTYAVEAGLIESNPAHGIRKPKGQCTKASALRGGVLNIRSDTLRCRQAGEIRYGRGHHSPACVDRLPPKRDDRLEMDGGRHPDIPANASSSKTASIAGSFPVSSLCSGIVALLPAARMP